MMAWRDVIMNMRAQSLVQSSRTLRVGGASVAYGTVKAKDFFFQFRLFFSVPETTSKGTVTQ
ncbi:hypothetical protein OUZ56_027383 [Daphnia magna]|uniref:Uncharacterized protein n=1 Tax=Daphnia magna TaxID=35525 RepID=A0ABQ9ZQ01_9CRUS|nr:hypothetical protein OUZ56_027383 [Daphnia magna]